MQFVMAYITFPTAEDAERIVGALLDARIIACANLVPIESRYRWRGAIERARETAAIVKTVPERWDELCAEVARLHGYEIPCIVRVDAAATAAFGAWLYEETHP
ncbi:MAG TPA: divalent-cation tolerance protein CutA [Planctomycetes bacterium]|nr:divalent-cation tolerance protein CutA [Planctomycetota bacterium]